MGFKVASDIGSAECIQSTVSLSLSLFGRKAMLRSHKNVQIWGSLGTDGQTRLFRHSFSTHLAW